MAQPVQITLTETSRDAQSVTYGYRGPGIEYVSAIVISRHIFELLGKPDTITTRIQGA